jgi:protein-S-isoprenylcysteine O-methyltransferase Ste14
MGNDRAIGGIILALCATVAVFFVVTLLYPQWLSNIGVQATWSEVQFWIIATPVLIVFVAIMAIGGWIGFTMATTPPPKPIEEITTPSETEETENKELAKS